MKLEDLQDNVTINLNCEMSKYFDELKDFVGQSEKVRKQDKDDILNQISKKKAIDADVDINSLFKTHISDLKTKL